MTAVKAPGRYDVQHSGTSYTDCVVQGLEWAARQVLRQQRHAEPGAVANGGGVRRRSDVGNASKPKSGDRGRQP